MATRNPLVSVGGALQEIAAADQVHPRNLGTGTRNGTRVLRDDGSWVDTNRTIGISIDGAGSVISPGLKGYIVAGFSGTIVGWDIVADAAGGTVIDVWNAGPSAIPVVADSIAGTEKPTLTASQIAGSLSVTTWTTAITTGDVIAFNVDTISGITKLTLTIRITG